MSAMIGINDLDTVHLLTDAAGTYRKDGLVAVIHTKQLLLRCGAVLASNGLWSPALRFARLADERASTFDELVAIAPELWDQAKAPLPDSSKGTPHAALLAGWLTEKARVEMHVLQEVGDDSGHCPDMLIYATGPAESDSCKEFVHAFITRFSADPGQFDPHRDGIEFMQTLRRDHPRQYELTQRAAVGGYITHTTVTREGFETCRIHEWPDFVGRPIDAEKAGLSMWRIATAAASMIAGWGARTPTEIDISWALAKPSRQEKVDATFGRGAYDRELAKRCPPRRPHRPRGESNAQA